MEVHDAANIFPMDEEHIDDLSADIKKNGLLVPIETLDGKILDGRRRFRACEIAEVKPTTREVKTADPVAYVLSLNLHRRHLSPSQLSMVGQRAREVYDKQAKDRQAAGQKSGGRGNTKNSVENLPPSLDSGKARDAAGKAVGVGGKSIDYAKKVLSYGTDRLIAAVDSDKISVSTAARAATMSVDEQDALVDRAESRIANGHKKKMRPVLDADCPDDVSEPDGEIKGVGVYRANEAIDCLMRIPKNDALRKRGFQIVTDWIRRNK